MRSILARACATIVSHRHAPLGMYWRPLHSAHHQWEGSCPDQDRNTAISIMERRTFAVCTDCLLLLRHSRATQFRAAALSQQPWRPNRSSSSNAHTKRIRAVEGARPRFSIRPRHTRTIASHSTQSPPPRVQASDLNSLHARILELSSSVLRPSDTVLPTEQRILYVLEQIESIATALLDEKEIEVAPKSKASHRTTKRESATSALLGTVNARQNPAFISRTSLLSTISEQAEEIVRNPNVFITPGILKAYVELQALLRQPSSFPDVFDLYARKPIPTGSSKSGLINYSPASPDKINSAIDSNTANLALTCAIRTHDLPLAIDIITMSLSTLAFKKAKILRQAAFPIAGLAIAPVAAYTLSSQFATYQQTMDPSTATGIAFTGILTYVGAVSMVGYVTVTTANDHMERVTWASGVPLWERWIREEERAAADRIACAWGFRDIDKRGEEEGIEWENLREWLGMKGMVLDRVSLMEGME